MDEFIDAYPKKIKPFESWLDSYLQKKKNKAHHEVLQTLKRYCRYCRREFSHYVEKTKDHVIPKSRGGYDKKENRVYCCNDCNQWKSDKMPDVWLIELKKVLKKDKYHTPYTRTMVGNMIGALKIEISDKKSKSKKVSEYKV